MLDQNTQEQLKNLFSKLENKIQIIISDLEHEKKEELVNFLQAVADCSDQLEIQKSSDLKELTFELFKENKESGISFCGIPSGHEFSSLILAILNLDGKGKIPDQVILDRIKNLKGPIRLKSYISLTCENCPDVVQALNLMAVFHSDLEHQMVDGQYAQEEVKELKVQGVPSVVSGDQLLHSGKSSLMELLEKLEKHFGSEAQDSNSEGSTDLGLYDVAVIGAGPAGVSAAIYTARKGLKTIVISDRVGGQVQDTKGIENLISVPYIEGPELSEKLYKHLKEYDIQLLENRRVEKLFTLEAAEKTKSLKLNTQEELTAKTVILATGAKWRELGVPGEKEYLGRGVAFCPHCDGPYYKAKDICVIGGGNSGVEAAIDLAGIVKSVKVLEFSDKLKADQVLVEKLESLENVEVFTQVATQAVKGDGSKVVALEYQDRATQEIKEIPLDGVFVQIGLLPNSQFLKDFVKLSEYGEILIDSKCKTSVEGVYAAGDVTNVPYKQIIVSMGEGAKAGLAAAEYLQL